MEKDKSNWGSYRESAFALRWSLALGFQSTRVGRAAEPRLCVAFEFGLRTLGFQSTRVGRAAEPGLCVAFEFGLRTLGFQSTWVSKIGFADDLKSYLPNWVMKEFFAKVFYKISNVGDRICDKKPLAALAALKY